MQWTTACPDWEQKLRLRQSIIPAPLFPNEADAGLAVLRELKIAAATIGNFVEWFDFAVYGFLATTIAQQFFPSGLNAKATANTANVLSSAALVSPLGKNCRAMVVARKPAV